VKKFKHYNNSTTTTLRPWVYLAPLWRYGASKTCTNTHMERRTDRQNDLSHTI